MKHLYADENCRELRAIAGFTRLPDYAANYQESKEASIHEDEYADDSGREYPIHCKAATWLSGAYFALRKAAGARSEVFRGQHVYIDANIKRAAAAYGIRNDLDRAVREITDGITAQRNGEVGDEHYGLVTRKLGGDVERRFPMFDAEGVRKAADAYARKRAGLAYGQRRTVASSVLTKAAKYGVPDAEIPDIVWSDAGNGISSPRMIATELEKRAQLLDAGEPVVAGALRKIAANLRVTPASEYSDDQAHRTAELLERVDISCKLAEHYGTTLQPPSVAVFAIPVYKAAAMCASEVCLNGRRMKLAALAAVPTAVYHAALGKTAQEALGAGMDATKLATMLRGLDAGQQAALDAELRAQLVAG